MTKRTELEWRTLADLSVAQAKREILADMVGGIVPDTVRTFEELHDYVDANEYGGLCDNGWMQHEADEVTEETWHWANVVQTELHVWLQTRRAVIIPGKDGQ